MRSLFAISSPWAWAALSRYFFGYRFAYGMKATDRRSNSTLSCLLMRTSAMKVQNLDPLAQFYFLGNVRRGPVLSAPGPAELYVAYFSDTINQ